MSMSSHCLMDSCPDRASLKDPFTFMLDGTDVLLGWSGMRNAERVAAGPNLQLGSHKIAWLLPAVNAGTVGHRLVLIV